MPISKDSSARPNETPAWTKNAVVLVGCLGVLMAFTLDPRTAAAHADNYSVRLGWFPLAVADSST